MHDKSISLRLTPELFDELLQRAEAHGVTVSEFVRRSVEAQLRPPVSMHLSTLTAGCPQDVVTIYSYTTAGGLA